MKREYTITYLKCQGCTAKIHCEQCAEEVCARLAGRCGVTAARADIPAGWIELECVPGADEDDILDMLEDAGVFV